MDESYIGEIRLFPFRMPLLGWLPCDGRSVAISEFVELYALLGIIYGTAEAGLFRLPDLRGRVPLHRNPSRGGQSTLSAYELGEAGGTNAVLLDATNLPGHTHPVRVSTAPGTAKTFGGIYAAARSGTELYGAPTNLIALATDSISPVGRELATVSVSAGGKTVSQVISPARENRQAFMALSYFICVAGGAYPVPAPAT